MGNDFDHWENLRQKAEAKLEELKSLKSITLKDANSLLFELRVHQEELIMQNQQLRETQQQLETSRDRYSDLFDFAPVGYFILNRQGIITDVNITGSRLLNKNREQLIKIPFTLFTVNGSTGDNKLFPYLQQIFHTKETVSKELQIKTHTGETFPAQLEGVTLKKGSGDNDQCLITLRDVTYEKRTLELEEANNALKQEKERTQQYLDLAPVIFLVLDPEQNVQMINEAGCELLGIEKEWIVEKDWVQNFVAEADRQYVKEKYQKMLNDNSGQQVYCEYHVICREDKNILFAWNCAEFKGAEDQQRKILSVGKDLTEREQMEKAMMESLIEGEESERKRIAAELHDGIQPILSTIIRKVESFESQTQRYLNEKQKAYEDTRVLLERTINEIKEVTYDLVPSTLSDFGLEASLEDLCNNCDKNWKPEVKFHKTGIRKAIQETVQVGLYRIAQELLTNALKHADADTIHVQLIGHENTVVLMVEDDGKGFEVDEKDKGLGIDNITARVKAIEGWFDIDSTPEVGTTITVEVPYQLKLKETKKQ